MKKNSFLFLLLLALCALVSCTPPEEEVHPKRPSQRSANLKHYVSKAQNLRAQALARSKPLVSKPLLSADVFAKLHLQEDSRLSAFLTDYQKKLSASVRAASAARVADKAGKLLTKFRNEVVATAKEAKTPQELKEKIAALNEENTKALTALTQEEETHTWNIPDKKLLAYSQQMLEDSSRVLYNDILRDYGLPCAQKALPILKKAGDDSCLVLSSAPTTEDVEEELKRVAAEADSAFNEVLKKYGNPSVRFKQEEISAISAEAAASYTELEKQFEKLYGLGAVSQAKPIFESYQNGLQTLLSKPSRLSSKQEQLERLEGNFREEITSLQVRLNSDFERRAMARRLSATVE